MKKIASQVRNIAEIIGAKHGLYPAAIFLNWDDIAGNSNCSPIKITQSGVLYLAVSSQHSLEVSYAIPMLMEKVNGYFGFKAISKIVLQQSIVSPKRKIEEPVPAKRLEPIDLDLPPHLKKALQGLYQVLPE